MVLNARNITMYSMIALALAAFPPATAHANDYDVRILRDTWGVPHIFGKTDADAAYGLAFAHSEDDFATIQETLLLTRGILASFQGTQAAPMDFAVHLLRVWDFVNEKYESDLSPEVRAICEAYADGVNHYANLHPDEKIAELYPTTGKDIVAGFVFKGPFFYGLDNAILELFSDTRKREVSQRKTAMLRWRNVLTDGVHLGSNTMSVSPRRTADGSTFLAVNSHQPWEGPVAWYEAHVHSEEGWDAVGGTFPGAPVILHGHNRRLGWAHTVNSPDLIDIYLLEINPDNPDQYRFDGEWLDLDVRQVGLRVKMNENTVFPMRREALWSVYGPAVRTEHGTYAIRFANIGDIRQVEQWFRMNKAQNLDEFMDAMKMQSIPSLNVGYADADGNIMYMYNAHMPVRSEAYDWDLYLPGNTSETLWTEYVPFEETPIVLNPISGFVQNCNSTPFNTTIGKGNPDPSAYSKTLGIETHMTNRALRAVELFGGDMDIDWEEFKDYKFDRKYSINSDAAKVVKAILAAPAPEDPLAREAVEVIREWDLRTNPESSSAALAVHTALRSIRGNSIADIDTIFQNLREVAEILKTNHGRIDAPWAEVNRLRRGSLDVGLGGGPDILHAVYGGALRNDGTTTGRAGDCYILLVRWDDGGNVSSESVHQYGSATLDASSPHYADQVPLFVDRKLKPVWMDEEDIRKNLKAEYRPGDKPKG